MSGPDAGLGGGSYPFDRSRVTVGAVIVTYQRSEIVRGTLKAVVAQSRPPDWILVVDNDGDESLRRSLEEESFDVGYVGMPDNVGYGAALAAGMEKLRREHDPDWYWLLDDDTPPSLNDLADALTSASHESQPAVVANRGGHISWGRIRHDLRNVETLQRADFALVDGALVSRAAVDLVGFPRVDLFMMFEDLDYTTRIADAGGVLVVRPAETQAMHLGGESSWRAYYQARNHLRLALERKSFGWLWGWLYRILALSLTDVVRGRWGPLRMRWRGAIDGLRGTMGRTV